MNNPDSAAVLPALPFSALMQRKRSRSVRPNSAAAGAGGDVLSWAIVFQLELGTKFAAVPEPRRSAS